MKTLEYKMTRIINSKISYLTKSLISFLVVILLVFSAGTAIAGDISEASDTNNSLSVTCHNVAPIISGFTLQSGGADVINNSVDVNTWIYANVTIEDKNSWKDIGDNGYVCIHLYYDDGTDPGAYEETNNNYNVNLSYLDTATPTAPASGELSVAFPTSNEVTSGTHTVTEITLERNYTLSWQFKFRYLMKQADKPTTGGTTFNDVHSWNVKVTAYDGTNIVYQTNNETAAYEFGVYKYVSVSIGGDWAPAADIDPGSNSDCTAQTVTHCSNDNYNMTVWLQGALTCGSYTINNQHVTLKQAGDMSGDVAFNAGTGESNRLYVYGTAAPAYHAHATSGYQEVTGVNFNVAVPLGTVSGTYTALVTIKVVQEP